MWFWINRRQHTKEELNKRENAVCSLNVLSVVALLGADGDVVLPRFDHGLVLGHVLGAILGLGLVLGLGDVLGLVLDLGFVLDLGLGAVLGLVQRFGDILGLILGLRDVLGLVSCLVAGLVGGLSDILGLVLGGGDVLGNVVGLDLCLVLSLVLGLVQSGWHDLGLVHCLVYGYLEGSKVHKLFS